MSIHNSNTTSAQHQLVLDYLHAIPANNVEKTLSVLSEDFEYHFLPKSFNLPGATSGKPRSKVEFMEMLKSLAPLFKNFKYTVDEVIEEPGKLALHATSTAESFAGKPYGNEYMMIFHISSDPSDGKLKITSVRDMADSLYTANYFAELQKGSQT